MTIHPRLLWIGMLLAMSSQPCQSGSFEADVQPILQRRCIRCHGPEEQNAQVRLDKLSPRAAEHPNDAETWHDALNAINRGDMPPPGEAELSPSERSTLVAWLSETVEQAYRRNPAETATVVMRRLNAEEYQNTMRDLFGLDVDYTENLPPDERSEDGFKNNGAALRISAAQLECYLQAARSALDRVIVDGPAPEVFEHAAEDSVADKGRENWSKRLGRSGVFVARVPEFPDRGDFTIRIRAHAEIPAGQPLPRMQVRLGYRADTQTPSRIVNTVDVASDTTQEFVLRGRLEEFPLQSRTQSKYPGLLIWIQNVYADGQPAPKPEKVLVDQEGKKKKKEELVWPEDPEFPKVVIESLEFRAPEFQQWPPETHRRILFAEPSADLPERQLAEQVLRRFMGRALRRPADEPTLQRVLEFFDTVRPRVDSFRAAMRETLAMVLVLPEFLYRVEATGQPGDRLDDYELASRLSYFLWGSLPDHGLLELAAAGQLHQPATLRQQAVRLLGDPRSWSFIRQFSDQWWDLEGVDRVAINPNVYPDFDPALKADMRRETQHLFGEILFQDLSAMQLLRSDFAMLNQPLAEHYGLEGPRGRRFERVQLPEDRRGGLLKQASILLAQSSGEDSHPILRGVWLRDRLLNDPPAPPPPNVPNLDQQQVDASLLPLRQQLELHRENAACAHCHAGIDPWGIALESFDAVGLKRTEIVRRSGKRQKTYPVDAVADLPDGTQVEGADELAEYLVEHRGEQFARALTSKLLSYALGRSLGRGDRATVDSLVARFQETDYRLQPLIQAIVTSGPFLKH